MTTLCNRDLLVAVTILYLSFASFPLILARSISSPSVTPIHEQDIWNDSDKFNTYQPGKNYKGLSNVKKYFHELGYNIGNTPPSKFDDKFEENMVSAIKIYKKNYNLNPTGKLDHNTLRQLMTRGCGVHTVSHYQQRWPEGTSQLFYIYYPNPLFDEGFKNAVSKAFDTWKKVIGVRFEETFSYNTANITIAFECEDFFNAIYPNNITWAYAEASTSGKFLLNYNVTWVTSGDFTNVKDPSRAVDVETVAVHEIGHLLGLAHSDDRSAVMFYEVYPYSRKVTLAEDDIKGIKTLYNIKPPLYHQLKTINHKKLIYVTINENNNNNMLY